MPPTGEVTEVAGAAELSTFTVTTFEVVGLPASSVATALTLWLPAASVVVFQLYVYGAAVEVDLSALST